jgi:hypothetical protein
VHPDPCDPLVIVRLKEWMQLCDSKHTGCHVEEIPLLPTRVLDVKGGPSSPIAKLVETSAGQRAPYIALSHCWGKSNPFITTRDNLEDMMRSIVLDKAPATFRDAIRVSRELGIRYIWIDSLCIIQGDKEDWEIESSRMGGIYRDATLTISAANATADSEGFLKPRPFTHSTVKITSPWGQSAEVYLRANEPNRFSEVWNLQNSQMQPLDTRGWCLQEAYLSRRQLKFTHNRTLWSCQDAEFDESQQDNPDSGWGLPGAGAIVNTDNLLRGRVPRRHRTMNLMTPYQGWYRMIKDYKKRDLTFVSDTFPAISGLASIVADHDKGKYCAGVWWEDVAFGICWKRSSALSKQDDYLAPSWSWASLVGPVEFIDANELYLTQTKLTIMAGVVFHSFQVENRGVNEYGHIDNAWIKLEAPMASLERVEEEVFQISGTENPAEQAELSFDLPGENRGGLTALFLLRRLDNSQATQQIHLGYQEGVLGVILFGLIIRAAPHLLGKTYEAREKQDESRIYERVGFFRILTSIERESEFWSTGVTSVVLV